MLISSLKYTGSYNWLRKNGKGRRGQAIRASTCSTYLGVFFSSYWECSHFVSRRATWNPNYSSIAHCCSGVCELTDLLCAFLSKPAHNKKLEFVNLKVFLCFRGRKINESIEIKPESWRNLIEKELPGLLTLILEKIPPSLWMALFGQNSLGWVDLQCGWWIRLLCKNMATLSFAATNNWS